MHELNTVKLSANLLKISLLLSLLPSATFAVMTYSTLNITATEFSVDISGNLPASEPSAVPSYLIITNPTLNTAPGFVLANFAIPATASFSGSQSIKFDEFAGYWFHTGTEEAGDYLFVQFDSALSGSEGLNGTLSGTWSSDVFDPEEASSVNFYWGTNGMTVESGELLGSASLSAVPDSGSTAALLGAGVVALAFARRRLG